MKRLLVLVMTLSLCPMLWGCAGKEPWVSLTYHVTSSVMTEGCHFDLKREAETMLLSGYCYDGGSECRREQPKALSPEAARAILTLVPEKSTVPGKASNMADGRRVTVTLGYADGSEKKISLSPQQRDQLFALLQKELTGK